MKTTSSFLKAGLPLWVIRIVWIAALFGGIAAALYSLWALRDFQQSGIANVRGEWNADFSAIVLTPNDPHLAELIQPGDIILAQDGEPLPRRLTYSRVEVPPVYGKFGAETTITIQTPGEAPRDVRLTLDTIPNETFRALVARGIAKDMLEWVWIAFEILKIGFFWLLALFIVYRRPHDRMALITSAVMMMFATRVNSAEHLRYLPAYQYPLQTVTAFCSIGVYLMLQFPDGRWYPRLVTIPLWTAYILFYINRFTGTIDILNRYFIFLDLLFIISLVLIQFYRYRYHYNLLQRQQTRWLMAGMIATWTVFYVANIYVNLGGVYIGLFQAVTTIGAHVVILTVPLFITVAMLRYRLYDADYALNRSLVFSAVTLVLATLFAGLVVVLRLLLPDNEYSTLILVIAAAGVGAVFAPARRYVQSLIDRRFFRLRLDLNELAQRRKEAQQPVGTGALEGQVLQTIHLETLIGMGGMGEVYRGKTGSQRLAVKVLRPELAGSPQAVERFEQEALVMRRISHPNIVHLIDSGIANNTRYIVMEYIDGQPLDAYLLQKGCLPLAQTRLILKDVAAALDYIHGQGIVHRDIKPGNIILQDMRAVLTDFSIARHNDNMSGITNEGLAGTLDYMAPEQITMSSAIDRHTDVYSLGVMTYQMLTGELPFKGGVGQLVFAHLHTPAPNACDSRPDLPPHVGEVILRAMFKDPEDRFSSAKAFLAALSAS